MRPLAALLMLIVMGCAGSMRTLTILHTNDIHGRFMPERASWREDSAFVGGFAALSGALDSLRGVHEYSLYLDAGDLMTGNPICDQQVDGVEGGALLRLLQMCDVDAQCLGNHEFDLGAEHLREYVSEATYPLLCSNLADKRGEEALCAPYTILTSGKLRVGVIGLILNDLADVVSREAIAPFRVTEIAETAQRLIDELDPQTDLIVLLTHNGVEEDKELARAISGADIIVGGHSHTRLSEPVVENGVIIVQAGSYCKNLGELTIQICGDSVRSHSGKLIELEAARFSPDPRVQMYCDSFATIIDQVYGEVIAEAGEALTRSYNSSSPLGNLLCDLMRARYGSEIALTNSGGLRKDLSAGPITKLDCVELMPFMNAVCRFTISGAELQQFALKQAGAQLGGDLEVLQMSGLEIFYQRAADGSIAARVLVNGAEAIEDRQYSAVSIDYVLHSQWEKYLGFEPRAVDNSGLMFSKFIMLALSEAKQPILAPDDLRLHEELP
jgi:5'-nucleotidase/UDP-sugar diphosphatase